MFEAVANALADSVNALLIGILVAIGIMLPRGKYRRVATLVLLGDWLGVLAAAMLVMFVFLRFKSQVQALLESPVAGWTLIVVGIGLGVLAWRSKGKSNGMVDRLLDPLRTPSVITVAVGFIMGAVQSLTSVPFFAGLMNLAVGSFPHTVKYAGLIVYASLALSLPTVVGLFIALVRARPSSIAGRIFIWARGNSMLVALWGGVIVAVFLVVMGVISLITL